MWLDHLPTAVYRLHNASRELLYIGITANLDQRFTDHRFDKQWWPEVRWASVQWFEDRPTAARVEAEQLAAENPPYNRAGTIHLDRRAMRDEVKSGIRYLSMTLFIRQLAEVLDQVLRGGVVCLLKYKRPYAYLVPRLAYEAGQQDRALVAALQKNDPELYARLLAEVS